MSESESNFTPRAQQALALARKEVDRLRHNYVGTEHLLLGLINLSQGVAVNVLKKMGLDLGTVRNAVEKQVGTEPEPKPTGSIPYTPRAKKVLEMSRKEAKALNHSHIGTEHILLGLLREGEGVAARVLKSLDVDIERCRCEVIANLDLNFSGAPTTPETGSGPAFDRAIATRWKNTAVSPEFSQNTILVLARARREADWYHHASVGPEHILLALLGRTDDMALVLLTKIGVNPATLRAELQKEMMPGTEPAPIDKLVFSSAATQVIEKARAEAASFYHLEVELKHILLGLTSGVGGPAARVFAQFPIEYKVLRDLCAKV